ncbi:MAG TPA: VTT domain-containing protein, partial [Flavisolibacter sp.]|nr:VTT domain-containing protein [Flavisolibacter sp.]
MKETIVNLFQQYPNVAMLISILISIVVALLGIIPSVFVTAANILFFGFWEGTAISFIGESVGAILAFLLYRTGFKKSISAQLQKYPRVQRLTQAEGRQAFLLILALRLIPYVPSGLVTFAASVGRVSALTFFLSSSLGKMPALLIEAYSVFAVTQFRWQ